VEEALLALSIFDMIYDNITLKICATSSDYKFAAF
jgi:hypothetical protein